jgi:hypothetical protein
VLRVSAVPDLFHVRGQILLPGPKRFGRVHPSLRVECPSFQHHMSRFVVQSLTVRIARCWRPDGGQSSFSAHRLWGRRHMLCTGGGASGQRRRLKKRQSRDHPAVGRPGRIYWRNTGSGPPPESGMATLGPSGNRALRFSRYSPRRNPRLPGLEY